MTAWRKKLCALGSHDILDYVLHLDELQLLGFPSSNQEGYKQSSKEHGRAPKWFGLDCEMVITDQGHELARVSIVERSQALGSNEVVLDMFVKPEGDVRDYITEVSGVTEKDIASTASTLADAQLAVLSVIAADDLIVGHGLENDLHALQICHMRLVDTVVLYPHPDGLPAKRKLADLAFSVLGRSIQKGSHNSAEDAAVALELAALHVQGGRGRIIHEIIPSATCVSSEKLTAADLPYILACFGLLNDQVSAVYLHGSRALGTARNSSTDWDFWIILNEDAPAASNLEHSQLQFGNLEANLFTMSTWRSMVKTCIIWVHEAIWAPAHCIFKEDVDFRGEFRQYWRAIPKEAVLPMIRASVSYESSRKLGTAKVALKREDYHRCNKHLFIALRFLTYGIELAETGVIRDIACANHYWFDLLCNDKRDSWESYMEEYGPLLAEVRSKFKTVAPKIPRYGGFRDITDETYTSRSRRVAHEPEDDINIATFDKQVPALAILNSYDDPEVGLAILRSRFSIGVQRHAHYYDLVQLRYSAQSQEGHPVPDSARGLICEHRSGEGWRLIAYPFNRFFNMGEPCAADIDWESATVSEKMDGSLAILYWYDLAWRVASSRRPDASGLLGLRAASGGIPLSQLFWEVWESMTYELPPPPTESLHHCYMFELTSNRHPIVIRYGGDALTLIGCRDLLTLEELDPVEVARERGWNAAAAVDLGVCRSLSPDTMSNAAAALDPMTHEGFVVRDNCFRRVKVKCPGYVQAAWMFPLCPSRNLGKGHILKVILKGAASEFRVYCPEYNELVDSVQEEIDSFLQRVDNAYAELREISSPSDFAKCARKFPFHACLFDMRNHGTTSKEWAASSRYKHVEKLVFF